MPGCPSARRCFNSIRQIHLRVAVSIEASQPHLVYGKYSILGKRVLELENRRCESASSHPMLPERSPERALPYEAEPVCEEVAARAFWICRILKTSLGSGWLWTVAVSSSSCPTDSRQLSASILGDTIYHEPNVGEHPVSRRSSSHADLIIHFCKS